MNDVIRSRAPGWFRAVAVVALLWNLLGIGTYLMHVGLFGDPNAGASEAHRALAATIPTWVTGAYAIGVFGGTLGSLGLVLRKLWARPFLLLSLVAILAQTGWVLLVSGAPALEGYRAIVMPLIITGIALFLIWLADKAARRGWLG